MNNRSIEIAIIGAQKSGTTSVLRFLGSIDNLYSHQQKEFTFFVENEEYQKGYEAVFGSYFPDWNGQKVVVKNVGIMYFEEAAKRLSEHNPDCKIIVILRNPIDRAYSHFWYSKQLGFENENSFEAALELEENRLSENEQFVKHNAYFSRGLYANQLKTVYKYFDPSNVIVELYDDMIADQEKFYDGLCQKLGLNAPSKLPSVKNRGGRSKIPYLNKLVLQESSIKRISKVMVPKQIRKTIGGAIKKWNKSNHQPPSMNPRTRQLLQERYSGPNKELSGFINRNLDLWK
ncbi:sulfotransferase domain-containing protein [Ekhidna sp.]